MCVQLVVSAHIQEWMSRAFEVRVTVTLILFSAKFPNIDTMSVLGN